MRRGPLASGSQLSLSICQRRRTPPVPHFTAGMNRDSVCSRPQTKAHKIVGERAKGGLSTILSKASSSNHIGCYICNIIVLYYINVERWSLSFIKWSEGMVIVLVGLELALDLDLFAKVIEYGV